MKWFNKLLTIKSIVTLVLTVVFAVLTTGGEIAPEHFMTVYMEIIGFYFGTQFEKKQKYRSKRKCMQK